MERLRKCSLKGISSSWTPTKKGFWYIQPQHLFLQEENLPWYTHIDGRHRVAFQKDPAREQEPSAELSDNPQAIISAPCFPGSRTGRKLFLNSIFLYTKVADFFKKCKETLTFVPISTCPRSNNSIVPSNLYFKEYQTSAWPKTLTFSINSAKLGQVLLSTVSS